MVANTYPPPRRPKRPSDFNGWTPCVGGYRHRATGMTALRTMSLDSDAGDIDAEAMWRVRDCYDRLLGVFPSITEAMAFALSTSTLMEEP